MKYIVISIALLLFAQNTSAQNPIYFLIPADSMITTIIDNEQDQLFRYDNFSRRSLKPYAVAASEKELLQWRYPGIDTIEVISLSLVNYDGQFDWYPIKICNTQIRGYIEERHIASIKEYVQKYSRLKKKPFFLYRRVE